MQGRVLKDWQRAVIVPFYKGKGDKMECKNYRGISLLSIPGKVYIRVLIERVPEMTEEWNGEEQCGFRMRRRCADQVTVIRQMRE